MSNLGSFDLVAVGGGAGGLAAARAGAVAKKRVALISDSPIGGDCTWTGCVPSKTLISAAADGLDFSAAMRRVQSTVDHIAATEDADALEREGIVVIEGRAALVDSHTVDVDGRRISAEHIVLATGARVAVPPIPGLVETGYLTNEDLWEVGVAPRRLGVLGGGPIGCELAQALARLGVEVTVFEMAEQLLPREEPETSDVVRAALEADGVVVKTGQRVERVGRGGAGQPIWIHAGGAPVVVDEILLAAGRKPVTAGLGLDEIGVELTEDGHVKVDRKLRTSVPSIFAVGDVNGLQPFTHAADEQGRVAAWRALGRRMVWSFDAGRVPWVTFTVPEVARVGVAEADAPRGARVAYLPMAENDRAITAGQTAGFIKLIAAPRRVLRNAGGGQIVGATIVGERAGEMIHEPALMMLTKSFTGRLAQLGHAYPTWSVGLQKCAGQFFQEIEGRRARRVQR